MEYVSAKLSAPEDMDCHTPDLNNDCATASISCSDSVGRRPGAALVPSALQAVSGVSGPDSQCSCGTLADCSHDIGASYSLRPPSSRGTQRLGMVCQDIRSSPEAGPVRAMDQQFLPTGFGIMCGHMFERGTFGFNAALFGCQAPARPCLTLMQPFQTAGSLKTINMKT